MEPIVYLFGYDGWGNHLALMKKTFIKHNQQVRGRGLKWIDARLRRVVRARDFRENAPERILDPDHYTWIPEFGNLGILGGNEIKINDFKAGLKKFLKEVNEAKASKKDLILFCHCDNMFCHRYAIRDMIMESKEGAELDIREWPFNDDIETIDLSNMNVKVTDVALHIPLDIAIDGIVSPLIIAPATSILFSNKAGKVESRLAGRMLPSADETYAIIKTNLSEFPNESVYYVYTHKPLAELQKTFKGDRQGTYQDAVAWKDVVETMAGTGYYGLVNFIFFASSEDKTQLLYVARLTLVELNNKDKMETSYAFDNMTIVESDWNINKSTDFMLVDGKRLTPEFDQSYALVMQADEN